MNLLFVGITNHHHIQNFSKSIKKNLGYKLYAININPNYINNKSEDGLFEKELLVTRSDSHLKDTLSKIVTSMKAIISINDKIDIVHFDLI